MPVFPVRWRKRLVLPAKIAYHQQDSEHNQGTGIEGREALAPGSVSMAVAGKSAALISPRQQPHKVTAPPPSLMKGAAVRYGELSNRLFCVHQPYLSLFFQAQASQQLVKVLFLFAIWVWKLAASSHA